MATYPTFSQKEGGARQPRGGVLLRTASNGQTRPRALTSGIREDPVVVHSLTAAEMAELRTFYTNNRASEFEIYLKSEGVTINAFFRDPPWQQSVVMTSQGKRYRVTVNLIQAD